MNEDEQTYSERDIVLEFFPATSAALIPEPEPLEFEPTSRGGLLLKDADSRQSVHFVPLTPVGDTSTHLSCDLCKRSMPRQYIRFFRAEVPNSSGRRFRYVSLCSNRQTCRLGRSGHTSLRELWLKMLD